MPEALCGFSRRAWLLEWSWWHRARARPRPAMAGWGTQHDHHGQRQHVYAAARHRERGTVTFSWAGSNPHEVAWDSGATPLPTSSPTQTSGSYNTPLKVATNQNPCVVPRSRKSGTIVGA